MKVLLDTNIILDFLLSREPQKESAQKIFELATQSRITATLTANSITDIYYIVAKRLGDAPARAAIRDLLNILPIISVGGDDCARALDFPLPDFEDALIAVCADKGTIDYIITNDQKFLMMTAITAKVISSDRFLTSLGLG